MTALFITGTGTDIGKTFVAAGLIRHCRAAGRAVDALKPVVTGFDPARVMDSDPGVLLTALGRSVTPAEIERVAPWRYAAPVAPDLAAKREGRRVDFDRLVKFSQEAVASTRDIFLIEGIGGIMVPLNEKQTVLDWMLALRIPIVLVAGSYLGAISHTLTCLDVLTHRGLAPKLIVVNETPDSPVSAASTLQSISNIAHPPAIFTLHRAPPGATQDDIFAVLAELL